MPHHGEGREERRSAQGLWLGFGLAAILAAVGLSYLVAVVDLGGFGLWLMMGLVLLALVAAVLFGRNVRHRQRVQPP